jgi:hypothetical protein
MNTKLLIDAFVRQTTVLIAQVATAAGVRTPLAHVANQVFLDLTQALEEQGLGRKVVADMFGLVPAEGRSLDGERLERRRHAVGGGAPLHRGSRRRPARGPAQALRQR